MMGERKVDQGKLFYEFSLDRHVPQDHLLRSIDRFVDLEGVRAHLASFYSPIGRPSIDPELMIRMLLVSYCLGIRSERRLCEEVHLNLAYRWFCRLGLDGDVPDHSSFSKNRHGRFRDSDLLRELFESVVRRCMAEGLVGGEGFAVDASIIRADASRHRTAVEGAAGLPPEAASRAVQEYLAVLDHEAFGAATEVTPKSLSLSDPASRWTAAQAGPASFAYCTNYLIDLDHAVIVDVKPSTAVRQGELAACRTMIERANDSLGLYPEGSPPTRPTARPRCWSGWSTNRASPRTSRSSTNPGARTGPSRDPTSPTTTRATPTLDPQASCSNTAGGPSARRAPVRPRTTSCATAPAPTTADLAR
jgi:transposase